MALIPPNPDILDMQKKYWRKQIAWKNEIVPQMME